MDYAEGEGRLRSFLGGLLEFRTPELVDNAERRRLALLQFSSLLGIFSMLVYASMYALADPVVLRLPILMTFACIPAYALVYFLGRRGRSAAAKFLFNLILGGSIFCATWFLIGKGPGMHHFFFLSALVPLLYWQLREYPSIVLFMGANLAGFALVEGRRDESSILVHDFPRAWLGFFDVMSMLAVFLTIVILLVYFQRRADEDARVLNERAFELELLMRKYEELSKTDPLTGLINRRAMRMALDEERIRMTRHRGSFALLLLDIDHFKEANDLHGHEAGDIVLRELSTLLTSILREVDRVARWGGEEFLLLLPDTSLEGALVVAEKIRAAIETRRIVSGEASLCCTVTIGVALHDLSSQNLDETIRKADDAMYRGKREGRNRVVAAT